MAMSMDMHGTTAVVQDPCPSDIKDSTIVADICKSSTATKETNYGSYMVDSVVLRIMIQQDNCVCRVTIDNQKQPVYLGLRRYGASSTPEGGECGLAVDINHIPDISTGNVIAPIECLSNVVYRTIPLLPNSTLQFKTRIINGIFNRGYCMRIYPGINSNRSQVLRIECDDLITIYETAISGQIPDQTTSNTTTTERTEVSDTSTTDQTTTSDTTKTEPTPDKSMIHYTATWTSKIVKYSSIKTNTNLQTTDSLQSATKRPSKGNNKITELRTILQRESQNS